MKSIIETIIFCGGQALYLHGLRDDPQFYNSSLLELPSVNVGNFLELIRFRVAAGDEIKKKTTTNFKRTYYFYYAKYMSKTAQN